MNVTGRRRFIAMGITALVAVGMSACASSDGSAPVADTATFDELVDAARTEGEITLYGDAGEPTLQAWVEPFTEEYGIDVNILRLPESELFQRFSQENAAGQHLADIYSTANRASMDEAVDAEWIAEYTPKQADAFPTDHRRDGFYYPVQNGYFMAVAYNPTIMTDEEIELVQDDPIAAAGDPRFDGRVALGPPQAAQHAAAFYYLLTDGGTDWSSMEAIADNDAIVNPQSLPMLQSNIAGEYAIAIAVSDTLIAGQVLADAPVEFAYPVETTGGYFNTGVVEGASHPNAARLFMEWATTAEANDHYSQITQTIPANEDVEDTREIIDLDWYSAPDVDDVWFDWITDSDFLEASNGRGDFFDTWNETFGYSG